MNRQINNAAVVAVIVCLVAACSSTAEPESAPPTTLTTPPTPTAIEPPAAASTSPDEPLDDPATTVPSSPTPAASEPPEPSAPTTSQHAERTSCVTALSVRERAALVVWPAVYADDWSAAISTVRDNDVGGVLLMSQVGLDAATVTSRLAELEAASRHGLIVSTDEEGGDVQRLRNIGRLSSQRVVGRDFTTDGAAALIAEHGALVRSVGVDMVLGPVVDVEPNVGEVPLQPSRFFRGSPDIVSAYGAAYLDGWARADLFATLKHYPGHGAASGDTHTAAGVTPSLQDLEVFDLEPYRDLVGLVEDTQAAVMIGHLTVPGLSDGVPATRSPAAISYLRNDLGYGDALLVTDALGMSAVGLPEPEASVLALQAGIDVVLFTLGSQTSAIVDAIEVAVSSGALSEQHVTRAAAKVMSMLGRDGHTCNENR